MGLEVLQKIQSAQMDHDKIDLVGAAKTIAIGLGSGGVALLMNVSTWIQFLTLLCACLLVAVRLAYETLKFIRYARRDE